MRYARNFINYLSNYSDETLHILKKEITHRFCINLVLLRLILTNFLFFDLFCQENHSEIVFISLSPLPEQFTTTISSF